MEPGPLAGYKLLTPADSAYPLRLAERLANAGRRRSGPPTLSVLGPQDLLATRPAIAVAGSRAASPEALDDAAALGRECARRGWLVVSGGARGVDTCAVDAALEAYGKAVVVLAEGIEAGKARSLVRRYRCHGDRVAILSQFRPRERWKSWLAMERNLTVLALADALVVVAFGGPSDVAEPRPGAARQPLSGTLDAVAKAVQFSAPSRDSTAAWSGFLGVWTLAPVPVSERQPVDLRIVRLVCSPRQALHQIEHELARPSGVGNTHPELFDRVTVPPRDGTQLPLPGAEPPPPPDRPSSVAEETTPNPGNDSQLRLLEPRQGLLFERL